MKTIRRAASVGAALSLALGLAACGGDGDEEADGLAEVTWAQPTPESLAYHPYVVADELGYFEDEGLRVELAPASEDLATTTLVSNGSADVGAASANEVFFAIDAGADLTVHYDAMTSSPEGIVVPADSDVQDVAGLEGATIGIPSEEEKSLVTAALGTEGLGEADVEFVTIGGSGQTLANELERGNLDAFAGSLLDFSAVEAVGFDLRDVTPDLIASAPAAAVFAGPDMDPEQLEGFLGAFAKATALGETDPDQVEEILRERIPEEWQNEDVAEALLALGLDLWTPTEEGYGAIEEQRWSDAQSRLQESEGVGGDIDLDSLLDDQFVEAANEGL